MTVTTPFELRVDNGHVVRGDAAAGDEPGYVYVHGLGSARVGAKSESLLAHAQSHRRAFLRIDQRGHGESSGTLGVTTIGELIDDLQALLERTGPRRLVGSSLGGLVAAFAAAARPELVVGLCLLAPAFGSLHDIERRLDADGRMWTSNGIGFHVTQRVLDDARRLDERGLPARLPMPVFVVHGSADEVVPPRASERFVAAVPHALKDLWLVPGGDHRLDAAADGIWPRFDRLVG